MRCNCVVLYARCCGEASGLFFFCLTTAASDDPFQAALGAVLVHLRWLPPEGRRLALFVALYLGYFFAVLLWGLQRRSARLPPRFFPVIRSERACFAQLAPPRFKRSRTRCAFIPPRAGASSSSQSPSASSSAAPSSLPPPPPPPSPASRRTQPASGSPSASGGPRCSRRSRARATSCSDAWGSSSRRSTYISRGTRCGTGAL